MDHRRPRRPEVHERVSALYPGHVLAAMATYDPQSMSYLRIPSYLVMDEPGRAGYPIVSPTFNDRRFKFEWSEKTLRDLEARILRKADSVAGLAAQLGVEEN